MLYLVATYVIHEPENDTGSAKNFRAIETTHIPDSLQYLPCHPKICLKLTCYQQKLLQHAYVSME